MPHMLPKLLSSSITTTGVLDPTHDPLTAVTAPPRDESDEQRAARQQQEDNAKKVSDDIDKYLKRDGETVGRRRQFVQLLLLGQSESGKSSALKNFQFLYNPESLQAERAAWRMVIIFNLVRSIRMLHDIISEALRVQDASKMSPTSPFLTRSPIRDYSDLLPPLLPQAAMPLSHKQSAGSLVAPDPEGDLTDAASTHSGNTTSSTTANGTNPVKRASFFSKDKEPKDGVSKSRSADKRQQSRPATSSGMPSSAFCLPSSGFGSTRAKSNVTSPHGAPTRRGASDDWKLSAPPSLPLDRTHSGDSNGLRASSLTGSTLAGTSPSSAYQKTGPSSISGASDSGTSTGSRFARDRLKEEEGDEERDEENGPTFTNLHQLLLMRIKPLLTVELDLLKRLSMPDEYEAVRLDFNLSAMRDVAVNAARKSTSSSRSTGSKEKAPEAKRPHSSSGRPRARSSVDIPLSVVESLSTVSTSSSISTVTPKKEKKKSSSGSGNAASLSSASLEKLTGPRGERQKANSFNLAPPQQQANAHMGTVGPSGDRPYIVGVGHAFGQSRRASEGDEGTGNGRKLGSEQPTVPEFYVRSTENWKEKIWRWAKYDPSERLSKSGANGDHNLWDDEHDPAHLIQACARDIHALWEDPTVREYLRRHNHALEQSPGFFISDVDRIVSRDYVPSDDDILRARLKTIGVTEHALHIDTRGSVPKDWLVYDVGGSRTQRAAWMPFFDTSDAIIFIANVAGFDQNLAEDRSMNRMEDSLRLFRDLVSSPILKDVNIILFLNKVDLLEAKLKSGIRLADYFKRYGDRSNDKDTVLKYFRAKFGAIHQKFTPPQATRVFTIHETSLIDQQSTKVILQAVSRTIIQGHVQRHMT